MPKISVIMPCYDQAQYISESIEGVLQQTYNDFELIIVDDCSNDDSLDIIKKYENMDKRIVVIHHEMNKGVGASRNDAMAVSGGEYIAFCDSDDIWKKNKLDIQLAFLEKNQQIGLIHSDSIIINEKSEPTGERFSSIYQKGVKLSGDLFEELCVTNFINIATVVMRQKCLEDAVRFEEDLGSVEDWVYWVRVARKNTIYYIDDVLAKYRVHSRSTRLNRSNVTTKRIRGYKLILETYPDIPRKLRSRMLYLIGADYLSLTDKESAKVFFGRSLKANMFNMKSIVRYLIN
ncbi:MAG: glycosyltransferase [Proteobacteria bacterium]|nr:glycosyltransferase [Pseudomonadota bacterium]